MFERLKRIAAAAGRGASLALALACAVGAGCQAPGPTYRPPVDEEDQPPEGRRSDLLSVGDHVTVTFIDTPKAVPPIEQRIREDGTINLQFDVEIQAADKTLAELEDAIRNAFVPRYYRRLTVQVGTDTHFYWVGGEVVRPGRQPYAGAPTVLDAIVGAGDFTDFAKRSKVELTRRDAKKPIIVDCDRARRDSAYDLPVYPGDRIKVPRRLF